MPSQSLSTREEHQLCFMQRELEANFSSEEQL